MLASERHSQILALIEEKGTVRTIDLAEEFQVTDETIRRDLQVLAENRMLTRVHGGAASVNGGRPSLRSFTERRIVRVEEKQMIARSVLDEVQTGGTYAFDSSTTGFELVSIIPDLPFRIITNANAVAQHLTAFDNVELICTGGRYHRKTQTWVGRDGLDTLSTYNINIAFISCIGLDAERGPTEGFEQQADFKLRLIDQAERVVLLVDSSKFNQRSDYFFGRLEDFDLIVTDKYADHNFVRRLEAKGCEVRLAG